MSFSSPVDAAALHARARRRSVAWRRALCLGLVAVSGWASVGACRAQGAIKIPEIVLTKDLGPIGESADIIARDGGVSVPVRSVSLWIFDDTLTGQLTKHGIAQGTSHFISNSASSLPLPANTSHLDLNNDDTLPSGKLRQFIPFSPDEQAYDDAHTDANCSAGKKCKTRYGIWTLGATLDPATGQLYVAIASFVRGPGVRNAGSSQREDVQYGLSVSSGEANGWPVMTRPSQGVDPKRPTLLWSKTDVPFPGSAFVKDGYFYEYGQTQTPDPAGPSGNTQDSHQHLARVRLPQVLNRAAWQFYSASGAWTSGQESLADLFVARSNQTDVYYDAYLGAWMAVYMKLGQKAYFRVAAAPEGPWSAETLMFQGEAPTATHGLDLDYALRAHPELSADGGKTMYFSYSRDIDRGGGVGGQDLPVEQVVFRRPK